MSARLGTAAHIVPALNSIHHPPFSGPAPQDLWYEAYNEGGNRPTPLTYRKQLHIQEETMIGGERQARFPGRPLPHQWWSAVLNVLPLLLLIYPSTGELWQQDFEPLAKPLNSKSPGLSELNRTANQREPCAEWVA